MQCNLHILVHSVKFSKASINIYILKGANSSDLLYSTGACSTQRPFSALEKKRGRAFQGTTTYICSAEAGQELRTFFSYSLKQGMEMPAHFMTLKHSRI